MAQRGPQRGLTNCRSSPRTHCQSHHRPCQSQFPSLTQSKLQERRFRSATNQSLAGRTVQTQTSAEPQRAKPQTSYHKGAERGLRTLKQACYQEIPGSAMCVQNLDDSRGLAIRITYRISLRSSSLWEPRHPLLKVVRHSLLGVPSPAPRRRQVSGPLLLQILLSYRLGNGGLVGPQPSACSGTAFTEKKILDRCGNDPSAGSPTETLLRLHLPLNDKV